MGLFILIHEYIIYGGSNVDVGSVYMFIAMFISPGQISFNVVSLEVALSKNLEVIIDWC